MTSSAKIALGSGDFTASTGLGRQVVDELRWAIRPPWVWLTGVVANLVLAFAWLWVAPLVGRPHSDWAIMVGTYFAVWILADVTTTNVLGADAARVRRSLANGTPLRRILLVKNLTLLVIVGAPTALATGILTVASEADYRLLVTLPGVAFPILTWLGVGNVISVALAVPYVSLRTRWHQRRQRQTLRWLAACAVPYGLYLVVSPLGKVPRLLSQQLLHANGLLLRGGVLLGSGLGFWGLGTAIALAIGRWRPIALEAPG